MRFRCRLLVISVPLGSVSGTSALLPSVFSALLEFLISVSTSLLFGVLVCRVLLGWLEALLVRFRCRLLVVSVPLGSV